MRYLIARMGAALVATPNAAQEHDSEIDRERDRFLRPEAPIGTRFKQEPQTASVSDARQMQKRLAKCVYYANKDDANALLVNSDFDRIDFDAIDTDADELFDKLDFGRCLGRAMKQSQYKVYATMRYDTLRNLLAEEAYLYQNKQAPTRESDAPTLVEARFEDKTASPRTRVLAEVSDCISYRNPQGAHEFLDTTPGTSGETKAYEKIYGALLTCLETDEAPDLDTTMVRMMIADGMWARSNYGAFVSATNYSTEAE